MGTAPFPVKPMRTSRAQTSRVAHHTVNRLRFSTTGKSMYARIKKVQNESGRSRHSNTKSCYRAPFHRHSATRLERSRAEIHCVSIPGRYAYIFPICSGTGMLWRLRYNISPCCYSCFSGAQSWFQSVRIQRAFSVSVLSFCKFGTWAGSANFLDVTGPSMYRYEERRMCMWLKQKAWRLERCLLGAMK